MTTTSPQQPTLRLRGITKTFSGVRALRGVDFELRAGEVHALLGENGAGKSTLIKIIAGAHQPSGGTVELDGQPVTLRGPHDALHRGVAVVYQETSLAPDLSVLENLYLGAWKRAAGRIDWAAMRAEARELFDRLGMDIPLGRRVGDVSKAVAQQVEIARALLRNARILILDEPGSVLNDDELKSLHSLLVDSRQRGVAVVYISHRLEEIFRIADRITVLRDGESIATAPAAEVDEAWVINRMVGRDVAALHAHARQEPGAPVLQVEALRSGPEVRDVSFTLRAGEIVGIGGLVGCGRTEVAQAVAGLRPAESGTVRILGQEPPATPWARRRAGLGYLPGDRSGQGVFGGRSLISNLTLTTLSRYTRFGLLDNRRRAKAAAGRLDELGVRPAIPDYAIGDLSGGNQQKVLLGRVLEPKPSVVILEEPTSGVDIGAKLEIHKMVDALVADGVGVLLLSSDLPELVSMSDRVLVMSEGRVVGELPGGASPEDVMSLAFTSTPVVSEA
ncbi:sugar ABC transporter ATP-binding protein [Puerhibacterium puerhi]|uniref:sugar ABC transporter ATP-binding protein n=1 Tax=Puerhibacterium puerhi TaxID=2692623 RepID=UPI00135C0453|nr:sugar ABC transporter ATP-binding protein [Puerhibacterium puerhi]